jgi:SAM-dependent methyltransferase
MSILYWEWQEDRLKKDLKGCNNILDAGCGKISLLQGFSAYKVGVDIWQPYIEESKSKNIHNEYCLSDIYDYLKLQKDKSFDAIYFGAVVEHMDKQKAILVMREAERVTNDKIIIITTNGYIHHDEIDSNPYQAHVSGYEEELFQYYGYKVYGLLGWRPLRGEAGVTKIKPVILGETISNLTQYLTYKHPQYAFLLYAVRSKKHWETFN